jgi:hypothetical protein
MLNLQVILASDNVSRAATPNELIEAWAFGPIPFWASLLSYFLSVMYSVYILISTDTSNLTISDIFLFGFVCLYIIRIYFGILFLSYDKSIGAILKHLSHSKNVIYIVFQFIELFLCLSAPLAFSVLGGINGGCAIVGFESIILFAFWIIFWKEFLQKDQDWRGNLGTLALDILAIIPIILQLMSLSHMGYLDNLLDHKTIGAIFITFILFYSVFFLFEFSIVYIQSWRTFIRLTQVIFIDQPPEEPSTVLARRSRRTTR